MDEVSRGGDFDALLAVLDPDIVLRADHAAMAAGASSEVRGGAVWAPGGQPRVVISFTITCGKIAAINLLADPDYLRQLDLAILDH